MSDSRYNFQTAVGAPDAGFSARDFAQWLRHVAVRLFTTLLEWQERARQRRQLPQLDDRMLRDIGLSRADVSREAGKPFWMN